MSGYIQRLLDRGAGISTAPQSPTSLSRSGSPLADHDQRLHTPSFRGLGGAFDVPAAPLMDPRTETPLSSQTPTTVDMPSPHSTAPQSRSQNPNTTHPPFAAPMPAQAEAAPTTQMPFDPIAALRAQPLDAPEPQSESPRPHDLPPTASATPPAARTEPLPEPNADRNTSNARTTPLAETDIAARPAPATAQVSPPPTSYPTETPHITPSFWPTEGDLEPSAAPQPSPLPQNVTPRRSELDIAPDPTITARPPTAVSPMTEADQATLTTQETPDPRIVEKTIERVIEKPAATTADSPSPAQRKPITAASASKIGELPVRRRVHSVFGIRRA